VPEIASDRPMSQCTERGQGPGQFATGRFLLRRTKKEREVFQPPVQNSPFREPSTLAKPCLRPNSPTTGFLFLHPERQRRLVSVRAIQALSSNRSRDRGPAAFRHLPSPQVLLHLGRVGLPYERQDRLDLTVQKTPSRWTNYSNLSLAPPPFLALTPWSRLLCRPENSVDGWIKKHQRNFLWVAIRPKLALSWAPAPPRPRR
jgi:hypothetical protein